jgi:hypothetical protein
MTAPEVYRSLETALNQWAMYADMHERESNCNLKDEVSPEGDLYRQCLAALTAGKAAGVGELVAALKPLADGAARFDEVPGVVRYDDDLEVWQKPSWLCPLTVGDARRARAVLALLHRPAPDGEE